MGGGGGHGVAGHVYRQHRRRIEQIVLQRRNGVSQQEKDK